MAITYQTAHRLNEAIALEEQALKLKRQQFAPGDRMITASLDNLATCYEQSNRKPDADAMRQEIAKLKTARCGRITQ